MNESAVYDAILKRRSIREFLDRKVSQEQIDCMLHAAMAAPSACNLQPWAFIVVSDEALLKRLKKTTFQGDYNAPLAIVVCGIKKHIPWDGDGWIQDCGAAAQNIMLSAVEMGLASVCIGGFEEEELKELLEIPEDVLPLCILEIGYAAYSREPKSWYTDEAVFYQKYDANKKRVFRTIEMLEEDARRGII